MTTPCNPIGQTMSVGDATYTGVNGQLYATVTAHLNAEGGGHVHATLSTGELIVWNVRPGGRIDSEHDRRAPQRCLQFRGPMAVRDFETAITRLASNPAPAAYVVDTPVQPQVAPAAFPIAPAEAEARPLPSLTIPATGPAIAETGAIPVIALTPDEPETPADEPVIEAAPEPTPAPRPAFSLPVNRPS